MTHRNDARLQPADAPSSNGVRTLDELAARLRALRDGSGLSYRQLHQRIARLRRSRGVVEVPSYTTVYRCLQSGRVRLDADLVADVVHALSDDQAAAMQWRNTYLLVTGNASEASIVNVSNTLPRGVGNLAGRRAELQQALDVLGGQPTDRGPAVLAIDGMAGVGKTTLANRAAHEYLNHHDVDLRLTVNLRGHDPDRVPADPAAVLAAFIQCLGLPAHQIHALSLDARATKYRELLAGRRALIVLDNAADEDQVRPLLPHDPASRVLVTSRRHLDALRGVRHLHLDVLTPEAALDMLRMTAGAKRVGSDSSAACEIASLMGNLPLALALAGSHISATPQWSLRDHVDRLVERRQSLTIEDAVELAFSTSYTAMRSEHQALLRLLTVHPGGDFDAGAVSALAGLGLADTEERLSLLQADNLVRQLTTGRYELHDLVRAFAADRSRDEDPPRIRLRAFERLLAYHRRAANAAMDIYYPGEKHFRPDCPEPATSTPRFESREAARTWLDLERPNLVTAAIKAARHEPSHTVDLSRILYRYLDAEAHYPEGERLHTAAAEVSEGSDRGHALTSLGDTHRKLGRPREALNEHEEAVQVFRQANDRAGETRALQNWGITEWVLGHYAQAERHFRTSVDIAHHNGDLRTEGQAQACLGGVLKEQGRHEAALQVLEQALPKVRQTGNRVFEGQLLTDLGDLLCQMGSPTMAIEYLQAGLSLGRTFGNRAREADALNRLGDAQALLGRQDAALELHQQSLRIAQDSGIRPIEADALRSIADSLRDLGELEQSLEHYERALAIADEMGHRQEAARVHSQIASTYATTGDVAQALAHWRRALALFDDQNSPEAREVAAKVLQQE